MKVIYDSNVFIDFFREPSLRDEFEARTQRPLLLMSSVVAMELAAGCRLPKQAESLAAFLKPFEKAKRMVTPDHNDFSKAGSVLAALGVEGLTIGHRRNITNDILIALSAAKAGAILVTSNEKDFERIERHAKFRWMPPTKLTIGAH